MLCGSAAAAGRARSPTCGATRAAVTEAEGIRGFLDLLNAKYETDYGVDFLDPEVDSTVRVTPRSAFALVQADFSGSPTRWTFGE